MCEPNNNELAQWLRRGAPADPLDRQTPEYLVEFFKVRLPFYTLVRYEPLRGFWDFYRPLPEELERLMVVGGE